MTCFLVLLIFNLAFGAATVFFKDGSKELGNSAWIEGDNIYLNKSKEVFEYSADEVLMEKTQEFNQIGKFAIIATNDTKDGNSVKAGSNNDGDSASLDKDAYYKLVSENYSELEQTYNNYLELYSSNKMTAEELASKFAIFKNASGLDARFDGWVNMYPNSYSARLARGIHRVSDAWVKRGWNFAKDTTDEQMRGFKELLKEATIDLAKSLELYSKPVESYTYLIKVSKILSYEAGQGLLNAALKLDPKAYYPRYEYLNMITPKWGGSVEIMAGFINESRKSQMDENLKKRLDGEYYSYLAQQANFDQEYKTASDYYLKAYRITKNPDMLYYSSKNALDGSNFEIAFSRADELINAHPKYIYGYEQRGYLYETYYKKDSKAVNDYLRASDLGSSWAQNRIGWFYMTGSHVVTDLKKAKIHLSRAAKQNNKTAIVNLAILKNLQNKEKISK
jgi:TPR repeat protein